MGSDGFLNKLLGFMSPEAKLFEAADKNDLKGLRGLISKTPDIIKAVDSQRRTALHHAAINGNVEAVKILLVAKARIDSRDEDGCSPLHLAAEKGHLPVVQLLLEKRADPNLRNNQGYSPLFIAMEGNHSQVAESLREAGGLASARIHDAVAEKDMDRVKHLIHKYPEMVDEIEEKRNRTPLHEAVLINSIEMAKLLIEAGAKLNIQGEFGFTALHYAARNGNLDIIKILLEQKADTDIKDTYGNTPLAVAMKESQSAVEELLKQKGASESGGIHDAAKKGDLEKVKSILAGNPNLANLRDLKFDASPLLYAVFHGHREIVEILLDSGADPNAQNSAGKAAIHYAVEKGSREILDILLDRGASVNILTGYKLTPLHYAAETGQLDIARALMEKGAQVNSRSNVGLTPLHLASYYRNRKIAEVFIKAGADVNCCDNSNVTPLHFAARYGEVALARFLLQQGASINAGNLDMATPLHFAAENGQKEIIRFLISQGANIDARDRDGRTALHQAAYEGQTEVVELLLSLGADATQINCQGHTPLFYAIDRRNMDMWDMLARHSLGDDKFDASPLHFAAFIGKNDAAESFIQEGTQVDLPNRAGKTPLHFASCEGRTDTAQLLLNQGAKVDASCSRGMIPLHYAALTSQMDTARLLIKHGSPVDVRSTEGITPLLMAASHRREDMALFLLEQGADPGYADEKGNTPLHFAASHGSVELTRKLLAGGADVNITNAQGLTPLLLASREGHCETASLLLDAGGDPVTADATGNMPLHWSILKDCFDLARQLTGLGAGIDQPGESMMTPLHLAVRAGIEELCCTLVKMGVEVNPRDAGNYTPLYYARRGNRTQVADLLLSHGGIDPETDAIESSEKPTEETAVVPPESAEIPEPKAEAQETASVVQTPDKDEAPDASPEVSDDASPKPGWNMTRILLGNDSLKPVPPTELQQEAPGSAGPENKPADREPSAHKNVKINVVINKPVKKADDKPQRSSPGSLEIPEDLQGVLREIQSQAKFLGTVDVDPVLKWSAYSFVSCLTGNIRRIFPEAPGLAMIIARHKIEEMKEFRESYQKLDNIPRRFQDTYCGLYNVGVIDSFDILRSSQPSIHDLAWFVNDLGGKVVVNLCSQEVYWDNYTQAMEQDLCLEFQVEYYHFPLILFDPDPIPGEKIREIIDRINFHARPILVHDTRGIDRVSVIAAAYRMKYLGWPFEKAIEEARAYGFEPEENPNQLEILKTFEK